MSIFNNTFYPPPQGNYTPTTRTNNIIFTAGMTPRKEGVMINTGKITNRHPINFYKHAIQQATENALSAIRKSLYKKEQIDKILLLTIYINSEESFEEHSKIADIASDYLYKQLGYKGIGSRAAVGVQSLPKGASIEICMVLSVATC